MTTRSASDVFISRDWLPVLQEALSHGEHFVWSLQGTSMTPTLPPGRRIEIAALSGNPRVGDVIVFAVGKDLMAHRLVRRIGDTCITQGDGRLGPDPPIHSSQVLGIVVAASSENGRMYWPGRSSRLKAFLWIARYHVLRVPRRVRNSFRRLAGHSAA